MTNQSYEQQIGLLTNTTYGSQTIPTLLGNDGTTAGNYTNDHPVGQNAIVPNLSGYGLVFSNNSFTLMPGSAYDTFITNYGAPDMQVGPLPTTSITPVCPISPAQPVTISTS